MNLCLMQSSPDLLVFPFKFRSHKISIHNKIKGQFSGGSRISRRWGCGPRMGHGLPRWLLFIKFLCRNERIGSLRGGACRVRPLDLPMQFYCSFERKDLYLGMRLNLILKQMGKSTEFPEF